MQDEARNHLLAGAEAGMRYRLIVPKESLRGRSGTQLGQGAGSSLDFKDFREYQPGDDLRRIDWSIYARSDKLTVKLYREEVSPHMDLLIDSSFSMDLADTRKGEATYGLAALFSAAASNAHCSTTTWMQADGIVRVPHGSSHPGLWENILLDRRESPAEAMGARPPQWRKHGVRIILSDFFWPTDPHSFVKRVSEDAAGIALVQLVARADVTTPARGNTRIVDVENDQHLDIYIDAAAQKKYETSLATHEATWRQACEQHGATFHRVIAEDLLEDWNLPSLEAAEILGAL